jgi:Family of unknown function (DUF6515)
MTNTMTSSRTMKATFGALALAVALAVGGAANADPRFEHGGPRPGWDHHDMRFGHDHFYPGRGYYVHELPRDRVIVGGGRYYYSAGVWYAPRGPGWVVVGAPVGLFVPVLPVGYTTVYFGGVPYYYANDAYYEWVPEQNQYEVVAPPGDETAAQTQPPPEAAPPPARAGDDFFVYPKNGQSDDQQAQDKFECHKWASQQSGFDPTVSGGGVPPEQNASARSSYNRAMIACLDGRGYSVK